MNNKQTNLEKKDTGEKGDDGGKDAEKKDGLKKSLTLLDLIFFGLGNVTGAGIFVILKQTIKKGGRYTLPIFLLVSLISLIMGAVYLEIYNRYKSPITEYLAIKDTLGDTYGQIIIYTIYFFTVFSAVTILIALSKYISILPYFSWLNNYQSQVSLNIFLVLLMSYINYCGIETSKLVGNIIAITLLIFLIGIIASSIRLFDLTKFTTAPKVNMDSAIMSAVIAFFLFNGYDSIIKVSNEVIDEKHISYGLYITLVLTAVIYVFIIISCVSVLGFNKTVNTFSPLTKIYEILYGPTVGFIAYLVGFVIMFNTGFLSTLTATRFMYGCGDKKVIAYPEFWAKLNDNKAPINGIFITLVICILLALLDNEVILSVFTNFSLFIILNSLCIALLLIRWNERNDPSKHSKNYIMGNINNIPVIVVAEVLALSFLFYSVLKNNFYLSK
jgi:amino acid transporter